MTKIPTAEEMEQSGNYESYQSMMIEFAKLHVKAALEAQLSTLPKHFPDLWGRDLGFMWEAYPLENIK